MSFSVRLLSNTSYVVCYLWCYTYLRLEHSASQALTPDVVRQI